LFEAVRTPHSVPENVHVARFRSNRCANDVPAAQPLDAQSLDGVRQNDVVCLTVWKMLAAQRSQAVLQTATTPRATLQRARRRG